MASITKSPEASGVPLRETYFRLLAFTRSHWVLYALSFAGFVIYGASNAAFAHVMKLLIDAIQAGERREYFFPMLIVGLFAARGV